jgi:hypothetical protein
MLAGSQNEGIPAMLTFTIEYRGIRYSSGEQFACYNDVYAAVDRFRATIGNALDVHCYVADRSAHVANCMSMDDFIEAFTA